MNEKKIFDPAATLAALKRKYPDIPTRILKNGVDLERRWNPGTAQRYAAAFHASDQAKRLRKKFRVPHEVKQRVLSKPTKECLTALSERSHTFASLAELTGRNLQSTRNLCSYLREAGKRTDRLGDNGQARSNCHHQTRAGNIRAGLFPKPQVRPSLTNNMRYKQYSFEKINKLTIFQLKALWFKYGVAIDNLSNKRLRATYIEALKQVRLPDGKPLVRPIQYGYEPPTAS